MKYWKYETDGDDYFTLALADFERENGFYAEMDSQGRFPNQHPL